jgi:gag-polypeptide of LTR copia-type
VYHHVASETNAHELWKKLESLNKQKTTANKAFFIRKLVNLKFREGTSVAEHLNEFQSLINQLSAMKMTLEDELHALLLLKSLPDS